MFYHDAKEVIVSENNGNTNRSRSYWHSPKRTTNNNDNKTTRPRDSKKKWSCLMMDFDVSSYHWVKMKAKREISTKTLLGTRELENIWEHENDCDTNCNWCAHYCHQRIGTGTGRVGNKRTGGDHPNYSIIKIGQNTEESPGDLKRFAVTQTPVKNRHLTLVWKILIIEILRQ